MGCVSSNANEREQNVPPPVYGTKDDQKFIEVMNTSHSTVKKLKFDLVFSVDVSRSMLQQDAYDRKTNIPHLSRFEAVKRDVLMWYMQVAGTPRLNRCHLILFGEKVRVFEHVTYKEMESAFREAEGALEGYTRTDLALEAADVLFKQRSSPDTSFVNVVCSDGCPSAPDFDYNTLTTRIASILTEGMEGLQKDCSRSTSFVQYGVTNYHDTSDVSVFYNFLDNNLKNYAKQYFLQKYPKMTEDDLKFVLDFCDTGKQCETWRTKDPLERKRSMKRSKRWDDDIIPMMEVAISD